MPWYTTADARKNAERQSMNERKCTRRRRMTREDIQEIKDLLNEETDNWRLDAGDWIGYVEELVEEVERLRNCKYRHKRDDGWICLKCGVRKADWLEADIKGRNDHV